MSYASQKQLKQVVEKIENKKASKTGVYPELVAGNLIDTKADPTPRVFSFDSSCGDASISGDGSATIKSIKGNTNVFNQMVKDSEYVDEVGVGVVSMDVPEHTISQRPSSLKTLGGHIEKDNTLTFRAGVLGNTRKWNQLVPIISTVSDKGITLTNNGDGTYTLNGTATATTYFYFTNIQNIRGHKIFVGFANLNTAVEGLVLLDGNSGAGLTGTKILVNWTYSDNFICDIKVSNGTTLNNFVIQPFFIDLTSIYGTGNEPTDMNDERVQQLIAYAQSHPEYDEGSVRSVELNEVEYCGENLWTWYTSKRMQISALLLNREITFSTPNIVTFSVKVKPIEYPNNKLFFNITYEDSTTEIVYFYNTMSSEVTSLHLKTSKKVTKISSDYNFGGLCDIDYFVVSINSQSITFSQPISLNGLETKDELYSQVEGNELVTYKLQRYGKVDLGTLNWTYVSGNGYFYTKLEDKVAGSTRNVLCSKYSYKYYYSDGPHDKTIADSAEHTEKEIGIFDSAYTDATTFKTAMQGVELVYELATPTITEISRVPLTCDFTHVENVLTDNTSLAQDTPNIEKGVVVSSMTEKVESIGVNIWDEEWEVGGYDNDAGMAIDYTTTIRSKSDKYIRVMPNTTYYAKTANTKMYICQYDVNKNFISYVPDTFGIIDGTFKTATNCEYLRFQMGSSYGTTYNHDICINVSNDAINGTYIPYFSYNFPIPSSIQSLEGYGWGVNDSLYNYIDFQNKKFVKRVGMVDLGTIDWIYGTWGNGNCFTNSSDISNIKPYTNNASKANILCSIYTTETADNVYIQSSNMIVCLNNSILRIINTSYTNATTFKTAMSGVYLYYELATAVETDLSDILTDEDAKIMVEAGGTVYFTAKTNANIGWNKDQYTIPLITTHKYLHKDRTNGTNDIKTGLSSLVVNSADNATGDNLINLTHMFGSGKEPATFDELCRIYPKLREDIPYNEGKMVNYKGIGIRTTGFNQWDEQWEVGSFDNKGQPIQGDSIRSKNFIKVVSNTIYYFHSGGNNWFVIYFYDSKKNFISSVERNNNAANTPENAMYMKFRMDVSYGTTYNNNICINLVWSGYRNGEYEPHWNNTLDLSNVTKIQNHATKSYIREGSVEFSNEWLSLTADGEALTPATNKAYKIVSQGDYLNKVYFWNGKVYEEDTTGKNLLFPDGLLSVGDIHDEVFADHAIKRIGKIVLSGSDFKSYDDGSPYTWSLKELITIPGSNNKTNSLLKADKYNGVTTESGSDFKDHYIWLFSNGALRLKIYGLNSLNEYVKYLNNNPFIIYYVIKNPIVATFDDNDDTGSANQLAPLDMSYKVADFGTEESLPENGNVIPEFAPLVADIIYSSDFTRQLVTMNKNYVSVESLDNLITIISSITGTTIEKVWDSENSKWNFVIRQGG